MRSFTEWQKLFGEAALKKFPDRKKWSQQDQILSIARQVGDVSQEFQFQEGLYGKGTGNSVDHRIAALIADALVLAHIRESDIDAEIEKVLMWYQDSDAKVSK